jgi:hypothetical protein
MTERLNACPICEGKKVVWRGCQGGDWEPCECAKPPVLVGRLVSHAEAERLAADRPSDAELRAAVAAAIEQWKTARQLAYLSPSACKQLNYLIVAGLRPVLGIRMGRGSEQQTTYMRGGIRCSLS